MTDYEIIYVNGANGMFDQMYIENGKVVAAGRGNKWYLPEKRIQPRSGGRVVWKWCSGEYTPESIRDKMFRGTIRWVSDRKYYKLPRYA